MHTGIKNLAWLHHALAILCPGIEIFVGVDPRVHPCVAAMHSRTAPTIGTTCLGGHTTPAGPQIILTLRALLEENQMVAVRQICNDWIAECLGCTVALRITVIARHGRLGSHLLGSMKSKNIEITLQGPHIKKRQNTSFHGMIDNNERYS